MPDLRARAWPAAAKTLTVDGKVSLIGSSNLDLRSFDLNYENNILLYDEAVTASIDQRRSNTWQIRRVGCQKCFRGLLSAHLEQRHRYHWAGAISLWLSKALVFSFLAFRHTA